MPNSIDRDSYHVSDSRLQSILTLKKQVQEILNEPIQLQHSISFLTETDILPLDDFTLPNKRKASYTDINDIMDAINQDYSDIYSTDADMESTDYGEVIDWDSIAEWSPVIRNDNVREPSWVDSKLQQSLRKVPNFESEIKSPLHVDITHSIMNPFDETTSTSTESVRNDSIDSVNSIDFCNSGSTSFIEKKGETQTISTDNVSHFCASCLGIVSNACILPPRPKKSAQRYMHGLF
jgi:hypothetical protein